MTRVDVLVSRVLEGDAIKLLSIYEPTKRFGEFSHRRPVDGDFVVYAEPRTNGVGWLSYWTGYGIRSIETADQKWFVERVKECWQVRKLKGRAKINAMFDWGVMCCERRITAWDGVNAIRNALHPGRDFQYFERSRSVVKGTRQGQLREIFDRIRDGWTDDWRVATVLMEAIAYLSDDRFFHHEVRYYSSRLIEKTTGWRTHLQAFWRDYRARGGLLKE